MSALLAVGCGDDAPSLDDFLPDVPAPTGEAQSVFAGEITAERSAELIPGPAASGRVGDFFMRNTRARFVIESPTRLISISPAGGNLVDAVPLGADGADLREDHFGELSMIYLLGRTCEHTRMDVVQDGSGGGAAVLRARGVAATNDAINLNGIGLLPVGPELDPDIEDGVECATTYVLEPDSDVLQVRWTLFNPGADDITGPFGLLNDVGGVTEVWGARRGFERLGIDALASINQPAPVEYLVYQGPDVSYGLLPRHEDPTTPSAGFFVSGVSVVVYGAQTLLDLFDTDESYLELPGGSGLTHAIDISVGLDAADAEEAFRVGYGQPVAELAGEVAFDDGSVPAGARVALFDDVDGNGAVGADDAIVSYIDIDASGAFAGAIRPGNYLARAEVKNTARSEVQSVSLAEAGVRDLSFTLPTPVAFDFSITDGETGNLIPGKLTVIGRNPARVDARVFEAADRVTNAVAMQHAIRGTTTDVGDGADPPLVLPAGGPYKIVASRGTEWSAASQVLTVEPGAPQELAFELRRVAPAEGYVSADFHVHQIGSPDSAVPEDLRVATAVAEGVEVFAATDHNYVSDLQPVIAGLGLERVVRNLAGIEITPFAYGHFNAFPITRDTTLPHNGAIDWARGMGGFAMIPGELFDAARDRGAELVQVNHPRTVEISDFLNYFDRAGLELDYDNRLLVADMGPVPNSFLRLPEVSLWDDSFNMLEVWNRMVLEDANADGVREIAPLDLVMRDWFGLLSLGMEVTAAGNSDTHKAFGASLGMPRTYVRVADDSENAIASGAVVGDMLDTLTGRAPRDVVVTNGPQVAVTAGGQQASALGRVIDAGGDTVTLSVSVTAPDWAVFDTVEVFANATPDVTAALTALQPLYCFTSRDAGDIAGNDVCALATGGAQPMTVDEQSVGGHGRLVATVDVTVSAADVAAATRAGATGTDAWLVVRVRGDRAVFPLDLRAGVTTADRLDVLIEGDAGEIDQALQGVGVPATAFTAPVFIDFDGGGYAAPFGPQ